MLGICPTLDNNKEVNIFLDNIFNKKKTNIEIKTCLFLSSSLLQGETFWYGKYNNKYNIYYYIKSLKFD